MSKNDILKFCAIVLMISLSVFFISCSCYLVSRILNPEFKVKLDSEYLQNEIVSALVTTNVVQDLEDIKGATN